MRRGWIGLLARRIGLLSASSRPTPGSDLGADFVPAHSCEGSAGLTPDFRASSRNRVANEPQDVLSWHVKLGAIPEVFLKFEGSPASAGRARRRWHRLAAFVESGVRAAERRREGLGRTSRPNRQVTIGRLSARP